MSEGKDELLFLGDVVPHKPVRFNNRHRTVINLECPIVIDESPPARGKINLSVSNNYLTDIFKSNLEIACLANNHIFDFGIKGLNSTISQLEKDGTKWFGIERESDKRLTPLIYELNNTKVALIAAICSSTSPISELESSTFINLLDVDLIATKVNKLKTIADRVVLYLHWGEEESSYPKEEDIRIARRLIEAGVDIIVGSHAHSPQAIEKYKEGIIAYNLGNFLMPALKNIPSYFGNSGSPQSYFNKLLMPWNRISWGLLVNIKTLNFKVKKYIYLFNCIIELPISPFDKYINLKEVTPNGTYSKAKNEHIKKREKFSKMIHFMANPYIPQRIKKKLWN
jgi:poly-gamma-glutamate synthesis protein (capsule biosynthesis protein)